MEPSEAQYLIINALDTLDLLSSNLYDEDTGDWYIRTNSQPDFTRCHHPAKWRCCSP